MAESTCEDCGAAVATSALICPVCGADAGLPPPPPSPPAPASIPVTCVDPDCAYGGLVPTHRCEDCGADDGGASESGVSASARLRFPWGGEDVAVGAVLLVGRENSPLADRLQQYGNVSRRHAEIRSVGGLLLVVDLRSANGTFVNDQRVAPMEPHPVHRGDTVRFGAVLRAVVEGA